MSAEDEERLKSLLARFEPYRDEIKPHNAVAKAIAAERERCIRAIWNWPGLTDDEKRIAQTAIVEGK